jgi:hypothetical protein
MQSAVAHEYIPIVNNEQKYKDLFNENYVNIENYVNFIYNEIADTSSVTMSDTTGTNGTRTVPFFVLNKQLATHYLYDGSTADTSSVTMTGSGGSLWLSPYTDPYPIDSSYFANDSGNYTTGESSFTG